MNLSVNDQSKKKKRWLRRAGVIFFVLLLLGILGAGMAQVWYNNNLQPVSQESSTVRLEIPLNSSLDDIAKLLKDKSIIRSALAFKNYVRNNEYAESLRAGEYEFDPSKSVKDIVDIMIIGDEASDLITIPPGLRIDQLKARFIKNGFSAEEVENGFDQEQYRQHPALVSKPREASLEGYLYPESFKVTSSTTVKTIISQSLDEMAKRLTPERIQAYASEGLSSHQAIILASIIEREVPEPEDRRVVAQVFLKRIHDGMMLGADATYEYAAATTGGLASPELDSPYNTRKYTGLPPGPISNVDETALDALANPTSTDYLYYLSGDDGKTYYSKTFEEHEKNIVDHCQKNCQ